MAGGHSRSAGEGVGTIAFELERFELTDEQRIEVVGRWFGVRGRRFVRPTLSFDAGDGWQRALAELDHKPWAAEEGEPWIATFRFDVPADAGQAELAVAPDIAVDLPALRQPGQRRNGRRAKPTLIPRTEPARSEVAAAHDTGQASGNGKASAQDPRAELVEARTEIARLRETRDAAYQRLAGERKALAAAQAELNQARAADEEDSATAQSSSAELERMRFERDRAMVQRDEARAELRRARAERDAAVSRRDTAEGERDALAGEREALRRMREELKSSRAEIDGQREALTRERDLLARERRHARNEREQLTLDRGESTDALRAMARDCETLAERREQLARDVAALGTARDALAGEREALGREVESLRDDMPPAPGDALASARRPHPRRMRAAAEDAWSLVDRSRRSSLRWLALAALLALALALVLVVRLSM